MIAFLDTSALVKLYHEEDHTSQLQSLLAGDINNLCISAIASIEFRSAIWKKVREKAFSVEKAEEVINLFYEDRLLFTWINLTDELFNNAINLIMEYGSRGLRTLDSIQLASALTLKGENCISITYDKQLKDHMINERLNVYDK